MLALDIFYEAVSRLGQRLDLDSVGPASAALGCMLWHLVPSRRRLAVEAMRHHLGLSESEAKRLARRSFDENARSFLEILLTRQAGPRFLEERVILADGARETIEAIRSNPRPVVMATGHIGAWELLAGTVGLFPGRPRQVVVRRVKNRAFHESIVHMRGQPGVEVVDHRRAAFTVLKALKRNGIVAFLVDHNSSRDEAVFLPFLNDTAAVNMGPALLAVRAGADIHPACLLRAPGNRYVFHFDAPLDTRTLVGTREERIRQAAGFYTTAMERYVRLAPEQWFWMHKRWKTRPPDDKVR